MKLQLYLLLYSIKNSALKLITICFSFFLPISGILGLLFALILSDTATGIWKAKHQKQEITSQILLRKKINLPTIERKICMEEFLINILDNS